MGSAVNQTARQVGGAVGVALLVVLLGAPGRALGALGNFHHLWWFVALTAASSGAVCCLLPAPVTAPARRDQDALAGLELAQRLPDG